jgi:hypothetical protein
LKKYFVSAPQAQRGAKKDLALKLNVILAYQSVNQLETLASMVARYVC